MRIKHARVSSAVSFFEKKFMTKFDFLPYTSRYRPTVFFGCYSTYNRRPDIHLVSTHRSLAVVIWAGSDALYAAKNPKHYRDVFRSRNVRHVAISRHTSEDLLSLGVPHIYLPITPMDADPFRLVPLGPKVYVYSSRHHPQVYGMDDVRRALAMVPGVEAIVKYPSGAGSTPHEQMSEVYAQCFMGLRLSQHDGLSNTVVELGLMGRRCVWNGWLSNAIPWSSVKHVVRAIRRERKKVGTLQPQVAEAVRVDLSLPGNWLTTEFHGW